MDRAGPPPLTFAETRRLLRVDRQRLAACMAARGVPPSLVLSHAWLSVKLYRYASFFYARGATWTARALWHLDFWLTGADISPVSRIGEGFVVIHPFSVTVTGRAGRNFTIEGWGGLGGGLAREDIGAGPGMPMVGDDVELAHNAMVLGPVTIGDRVRIGPGCTVVRDVAPDTEVLVGEPRVRRGA